MILRSVSMNFNLKLQRNCNSSLKLKPDSEELPY